MNSEGEMDAQAFHLHVAQALTGCQFVEQELKLYIAEALELIRKCVGGRVVFKLTGEDYEESPLGRLIDTFNKLSDNPPLVAALRKFTKERNFLSHNAITRCMDYDGDFDPFAASEFEARLLAINPEAQGLRIAIHEEANKFRGDLDFGDFPVGNS